MMINNPINNQYAHAINYIVYILKWYGLITSQLYHLTHILLQ